MKRSVRLAQWTAGAAAILLLFWVAATVGGWSPDLRRLTTSVHGPLVGDYRAESPQRFSPLSPAITQAASADQAGGGKTRPGATPSGAPAPSASGTGPTPSGSGVLPTLPVPTPSIPLPTPTLPVPTLPVPTLPTPPALF